MITLNDSQIKAAHGIDSDTIVYIHYSDAKRSGIRTGVEFESEDGTLFVAGEYVNYRNDIHCEFKGFKCEILGSYACLDC